MIGSEWTLHQDLLRQWPAIIDLVATSLTGKAPSVLCPSVGTQGSGSRCIPPPLGHLQAYAFPPIAIIRRVTLDLRASHNCNLALIAPFWPQREWFPDLLELLSDIPIELPKRRDLLRPTAFPSVSRKSPYASSDCVATLKRFASQAGFSDTVEKIY